MPFVSQNEEKVYKKWFKGTPFNAMSQKLFGDIAPTPEMSLEIFRQENARTKAKEFIPFEDVFGESFLSKIPSELSEEQQNYLGTLTWNFIVNKIDAMNKVLEKSYKLFDAGKLEESLVIVKTLADAGHPEACYLMAVYALQGKGIDRNPSLAFKYGTKALEYVAHPRACLLLAGLYYEGLGVESNRRKAVSWILQAERTIEGDPSVCAFLAEYYQDGYIVGRDVEKAAHYAHKAE